MALNKSTDNTATFKDYDHATHGVSEVVSQAENSLLLSSGLKTQAAWTMLNSLQCYLISTKTIMYLLFHSKTLTGT